MRRGLFAFVGLGRMRIDRERRQSCERVIWVWKIYGFQTKKFTFKEFMHLMWWSNLKRFLLSNGI